MHSFIYYVHMYVVYKPHLLRVQSLAALANVLCITPSSWLARKPNDMFYPASHELEKDPLPAGIRVRVVEEES